MTIPVDPVLTATGLSLSEWKDMPWWVEPTGAIVIAGGGGHEREITVTLHDLSEDVAPHAHAALIALCPDAWRVEDRGTRIEVHPTGRSYSGFTAEDVDAVTLVLVAFGLDPASVEIVRH